MDYMNARGMLKPEEREHLAGESLFVGQNEAIINIGIEYGASMVCLGEHYLGTLLIGIDKDLTRIEQEVKDGLVGKAYFVMGDSHDQSTLKWIQKTLKAQEADVAVLFVDGDHTYEGALADADMYTRLVMVGGHAIFHDCFDWDHPDEVSQNSWVEGAGRAVADWYNDNREQWEDRGKVGTMRIFRRKEG